MKAVRIHEHGGLDVLRIETLPDPEPGPGELLLEMKAVGLNHLDTWVRRGVPGHRFPLPITPGSDGAGVVAALGPGVEGFAVGDRVAVAPGFSCGHCEACWSGRDHYCRHYGIRGESGDGVQCDLFALPVAGALPIPEGMSFETAAAVPLVFLTAWEMLVAKARVRSGDWVLVQAAGSGVSAASIQIARHFGATVVATAGTDAKLARARDLGAAHAINYEEQDFVAEVKRITGRRGVDIAVDHVGEKTIAGSLRCLALGGRVVTCGATTGPALEADLRAVFFKNLAVLGSTMGSRGTLPHILRLVAEGIFDPVIDRVLPLGEVAEAHRLMGERQQFGKIVMIPW